MKHSSSRGGGGGRTVANEKAEAPASTQPAQPVNRGPARRDGVAPEQHNDRVVNWVNQGQPDRNDPQQQQQKGGRKKRLAANFQTE
jgi:hypothetical protein